MTFGTKGPPSSPPIDFTRLTNSTRITRQASLQNRVTEKAKLRQEKREMISRLDAYTYIYIYIITSSKPSRRRAFVAKESFLSAERIKSTTRRANARGRQSVQFFCSRFRTRADLNRENFARNREKFPAANLMRSDRPTRNSIFMPYFSTNLHLAEESI